VDDDQLEHGSRRPARWVPWAATVAVAALVLAVAAALESGHGHGNGNTPGLVAETTSPAAQLSLPPCADPAASAQRLLDDTPAGPATGAITGDKVTTTFTLEAGAFTADPPPAGYQPAVTAEQAGCQLTSGYAPNGSASGPGRLALATVTIRLDVQVLTPLAVLGPNSAVPDLGPVPIYQHRVAWLLVTAANNNVGSCPLQLARGAPPSAPPSAPASGATASGPTSVYEVFAIDAATGTSAVLFEDTYRLCPGGAATPATVAVPYQVMSVPWSLKSIAPDQQTAVITGEWASCERYTSAGTTYGTQALTPAEIQQQQPFHAWIGQPQQPYVEITVNRPFGPPCGPPQPHRMTLHPERVGLSIPPHPEPGPLGIVASDN
jgi:hypothetical protein